MRDVENRYRGLPPRTPEMLYNIVRKFYRGAVSHYDLIQEKKREAYRAWEQFVRDGDDAPVRDSLHTLFLEYHFYTTCWLQIDLALYRLASRDEALARVRGSLQRFWKSISPFAGNWTIRNAVSRHNPGSSRTGPVSRKTGTGLRESVLQ
jgi:hypothetical protein